MARYLASVTLPYLSGVPTDVAVNTWAFESNDAVSVPQAEQVATALFDFYTSLGSEDFFSEGLSGDVEIAVYDIDAAEPRTPLISGTAEGALGTGANPLVDEVAICLSFRGPYVSGEPPARRRGRVFLGPLAETCSEEDGFGHAVPFFNAPVVISTAVEAMTTILEAEGLLHSVWSRSDDELYNVQQYWVDNRFDTQRRRGQEPTQKFGWLLGDIYTP